MYQCRKTVCERRHLAKYGSPRLCNTQSVNCIAGGFHGELSTAAIATERKRVFRMIHICLPYCLNATAPTKDNPNINPYSQA